MSVDGADPRVVREVLRDVLSELLPELVADARASAPASSVFPPPPVAAVHRPSTWQGTAATEDASTEVVSITSDEELAAFVRRLLALCENPRDHTAIRSGQRRFVLQRSGMAGTERAVVKRIDRGAVSERVVREAAATGSRLVLGPKAVLTPMGRDVARSLGVTIEKEKRC
jgi:hypothetical protein